MPTQIETFRIVAPEFATATDPNVQALLDLAPLFIDVTLYADSIRDLAIVYQAASLMAQQKQSASGNSTGGQLASEKEGDLARSYFKSGTAKIAATDIYAQQLDILSLAVGGILTRYGNIIPQGVDIG